MGHLFELGEHGLADDGAANLVDLLADQVGTLGLGLHALAHQLAQQLLVKRACHFRHEDGVVGVLVGLGGLRVVSVHRVPRLVRQREHTVQHFFLVVHQDVRRGPVGPIRERPAALPLVLVAVHPAVARQALLERAHIVVAQRRKALANQAHRLLVGNLGLLARGQRHGHVIRADVALLQRALAQIVIPVLGLTVRADGSHQAVIHSHRNLVAKQGPLAGARVIAHARAIHVLQHGARQGSRQRVGVRGVFFIELREGLLAHGAFLRFEQPAQRALRQLDLLAVLVGNEAELEVRVVQLREDVVRRPRHFALHGQQALFLQRQDMLAVPQQLLEREAEGGQFLAGKERLHLLRGDSLNLRRNEARGLARLGGEEGEARTHPLVGAVRNIFRILQAGIGRHLLAQLVELRIEIQAGPQRLGGFPQLALKLRKARDLRLELLVCLLPRRVVLEQLRQVPRVSKLHGTTRGDCYCLRHDRYHSFNNRFARVYATREAKSMSSMADLTDPQFRI